MKMIHSIIIDNPPKIISHNEATPHLEQLMVYFERQVETTPSELLMLKRIRNCTARKRYRKLAQQKLTKLFIIK